MATPSVQLHVRAPLWTMGGSRDLTLNEYDAMRDEDTARTALTAPLLSKGTRWAAPAEAVVVRRERWCAGWLSGCRAGSTGLGSDPSALLWGGLT